MIVWNKMAVVRFFDDAVRESSSFISKCSKNKRKTDEMFKNFLDCFQLRWGKA